MNRWATFCYRRRRAVVLAWIFLLAATSIGAQKWGGELSNDFSVPGTESQRAFDLLEERFPAQAGDTITIVYRADRGVTDNAVRSDIEELLASLGTMDHVSAVQSPYAPQATSISPDGQVAFATLQLDVKGPEVPRELVEEMRRRADAAEQKGLRIELGGNSVRFAEQEEPGEREALGLVAAIVILLLTFGSVIAMGLPILTALFGLGIGLSLVTLLANVSDVPTFSGALATMIGLGVGIDYALFVVTRYRHGLDAGFDPAEAVAVALDTSGRAVIFAGLTVVISLGGMFFVGIPFVGGLATGAMVAVLLVMLASITLLPALLGFVGRTIERWKVPGLHRRASSASTGFWVRWSRFIQAHPWTAALSALMVLVILALPVFSMRLAMGGAATDPSSLTSRRAYDLLAEGFGEGTNGPLILAARLSSLDDLETFEKLGKTLSQTRGVAAVTPPVPNPERDAAVMQVIPVAGPESKTTEDLIHRLRSEVIPAATRSGPEVAVGGVTALFVDMSEVLTDRLPVFMAAIIGFSFLLLAAVFRSLLVPLKAAVMNVLSIGASYGVVVAVFQWGWLKDLVGLDAIGPIESFLPMILFAILFGLSMDYEVFLLSRIREEYLRTGDNARSVGDGLAATARVITAAAAIMVTLFLSFVLGDDRIIKMAGLGLATAVFIDATVVRVVLVPATMELLGDANWWLPNWLDRLLPRIGVEGERAASLEVLEHEVVEITHEGAGGEPSP